MKVLFVCTGNLCRSPMAEYLAREIARQKGIEVEVPDPYGAARHAYRQIRDQIRRLVEKALEKIASTAKR